MTLSSYFAGSQAIQRPPNILSPARQNDLQASLIGRFSEKLLHPRQEWTIQRTSQRFGSLQVNCEPREGRHDTGLDLE
jgi:hypothetical protein